MAVWDIKTSSSSQKPRNKSFLAYISNNQVWCDKIGFFFSFDALYFQTYGEQVSKIQFHTQEWNYLYCKWANWAKAITIFPGGCYLALKKAKPTLNSPLSKLSSFPFMFWVPLPFLPPPNSSPPTLPSSLNDQQPYVTSKQQQAQWCKEWGNQDFCRGCRFPVWKFK